ncbi:MAG TPA: tRNA (guanosine(46)-N7)-methyltransferase TrmB [Steroidobacteraceae bacterium]|nr:tRNA (guanosine(46)-N7)-methyltransferase TrmB [Steroidobacteraceae bacterium]
MQPRRTIRSFVLRGGRVTVAQERALAQWWPRYGIDNTDGLLDLDRIFGRSAPRCMEIGFGAGEVLGALAETNPGVDYLGVEVHRAGIGRLLLRAANSQLANLRLLERDAVEVLAHNIPDRALDELLVFFPDPWHKKRHLKRRLIEPCFVATAAAKLRAGGTLRLATDWEPYAEQMLAVCEAEPRLRSLSPERRFVDRPPFRPATRFERRGERLGHPVRDLAYARRDG